MAASPSTVVTQGFGSFGGVALLPTLGFGIGEVVVTVDVYPGNSDWTTFFDNASALTPSNIPSSAPELDSLTPTVGTPPGDNDWTL